MLVAFAFAGCKVSHEFAKCRSDDECAGAARCGADGLCVPLSLADASSGGSSGKDAAAGGRTATSDGAPCEAGSCPLGEICANGRCIAPLEDRDGDGVPRGSDCDDADDSVTTTAQRACRSECADGIERCVMGLWEACDAPTDCDCDPDEQRTVNCGNCGVQNQVCNSQGRWTDVGGCGEQGECSAGVSEALGPCGDCGTEKRTCLADCRWDAPACTSEGECQAGGGESESEACGACGSSRTRRRTCDETCRFSAWDAWSACADTGGCPANQTDTATSGCGNCGSGTRSRTRTCDAAGCGWGAWGPWSACSGATGCTPNTPEVGTEPCGNCNAGSRSHTRTCDGTCAWGGWGAWGTCNGATGCAPNDVNNGAVSCTSEGNCRTVTTCGSTCTWGAPVTECAPCAPGAIDEETGGRCFLAPQEPDILHRSRTCGDSCAWGSWSSWRCGSVL